VVVNDAPAAPTLPLLLPLKKREEIAEDEDETARLMMMMKKKMRFVKSKSALSLSLLSSLSVLLL
jgi:hypothetical protein